MKTAPLRLLIRGSLVRAQEEEHRLRKALQKCKAFLYLHGYNIGTTNLHFFWNKNNCCGLSKYIDQSVHEELYIFHSHELCSKDFNFRLVVFTFNFVSILLELLRFTPLKGVVINAFTNLKESFMTLRTWGYLLKFSDSFDLNCDVSKKSKSVLIRKDSKFRSFT